MALKKLEEAVLNGTSGIALSRLVRKALKTTERDKIVSRLEPHLKHENPNVRLAAICALEKTKHYRLDALLEPLAKDKNVRVRSKAREVLKRREEDTEII